jgi:hypothetical protein
MESLIAYLIRCVLVSGLLTAYYMLALRGRRMHGFNRFYLLSSVVIALVLPLVHIPWAPWEASRGTAERVFIVLSPAAAGRSSGAFWWELGLGASALVSIGLLLISISKIRALYKLKGASRCTHVDDYELVETEAPGTPFSFFRNLFWRNGLDRDGAVNSRMLAHELAHIRGRHSRDIVGIQMVLCVFWMNPFFWYIRRELMLVLEFAADAASGAEGDPELLARMLLQAYAGGQAFAGGLSPALSNAFFHSPIKRRLVMITNNKRSRRAWLRKALVVPVVVGAVLFFACSKEESAKTPPPPPPPPGQEANAIDAKKLKMDSIQVKMIKYLPKSLVLVKGDGAKLQLKKSMDSIMVVRVPGNRIDVKD